MKEIDLNVVYLKHFLASVSELCSDLRLVSAAGLEEIDLFLFRS